MSALPTMRWELIKTGDDPKETCAPDRLIDGHPIEFRLQRVSGEDANGQAKSQFLDGDNHPRFRLPRPDASAGKSSSDRISVTFQEPEAATWGFP